MFLILLTKDVHRDESRKHLNNFNSLMDEGRIAITIAFIRKPLSSKLALMPMDIALLASFNMLHDLTNDDPNIEDTYSLYLNQLVSLSENCNRNHTR